MEEKIIYVVDDDEKIRNLISAYLVKEHFAVKSFSDGLEALEYFKMYPCHMLIVDIMMPKMDGYQLCREIRKTSDVPIIFVSAKDEEIDRIVGLELGSDDYISKPFSPRELIIRVKNIFRRMGSSTPQNSNENVLVFKDLTIYKDQRLILRNEEPIELTTKEFDLLYFLLENRNKAFSRVQLIQNIWGYDYIGETRPVDNLIKRLRKKLNEKSTQVEITTIWGYGYKIMD